MVQVPLTVAAAVGAAVTVQDARPLVRSTNPPEGMVSPALTGVPFCMATPQVPVVLTVALTPGMLVVQEPYVAGVVELLTGPASLWLPGAAGTWPLDVEVVQVTVTDPAVKVALPLRVAVKAWPAGLTVVAAAVPAGCAIAGPVTPADRPSAAAIPLPATTHVRLRDARAARDARDARDARGVSGRAGVGF
ncbi:hypothetical protein JCM4914_52720 [Streptomyces platensis subsp. malvinus]